MPPVAGTPQNLSERSNRLSRLAIVLIVAQPAVSLRLLLHQLGSRANEAFQAPPGDVRDCRGLVGRKERELTGLLWVLDAGMPPQHARAGGISLRSSKDSSTPANAKESRARGAGESPNRKLEAAPATPAYAIARFRRPSPPPCNRRLARLLWPGPA